MRIITIVTVFRFTWAYWRFSQKESHSSYGSHKLFMFVQLNFKILIISCYFFSLICSILTDWLCRFQMFPVHSNITFRQRFFLNWMKNMIVFCLILTILILKRLTEINCRIYGCQQNPTEKLSITKNFLASKCFATISNVCVACISHFYRKIIYNLFKWYFFGL